MEQLCGNSTWSRTSTNWNASSPKQPTLSQRTVGPERQEHWGYAEKASATTTSRSPQTASADHIGQDGWGSGASTATRTFPNTIQQGQTKNEGNNLPQPQLWRPNHQTICQQQQRIRCTCKQNSLETTFLSTQYMNRANLVKKLSMLCQPMLLHLQTAEPINCRSHPPQPIVMITTDGWFLRCILSTSRSSAEKPAKLVQALIWTPQTLWAATSKATGASAFPPATQPFTTLHLSGMEPPWRQHGPGKPAI